MMTAHELDTILAVLGWSRSRLADWLEVDRGTVGRWLRGARPIPKAVAVLLRVVVSFRLARDTALMSGTLDRLGASELLTQMNRLLPDV